MGTTQQDEEDIKTISEICLRRGWDMAIPGGDDQELKGLIIGEESYINYILKHLE